MRKKTVVVVIKKIGHILTGWGKSLGLIPITPAENKLSELRLKACKTCFHSKESKVLKIVKGTAEEELTLMCMLCGCPCKEKSLVVDEFCPKGKW